MNQEKIISNLNKYRSKIIEKLKEKNWSHFEDYFLIKEKFSSNKVDDAFKHLFCNFYRMNGPGGLNQLQKNKFFEILLAKENDLEKILDSLYEYNNSHKLFLSFGTKLLHTRKKDLPIYDNNVASVLELTTQKYPKLKYQVGDWSSISIICFKKLIASFGVSNKTA